MLESQGDEAALNVCLIVGAEHHGEGLEGSVRVGKRVQGKRF